MSGDASTALLELRDDLGDLGVDHLAHLALAVLGRVVEDERVAADDHVRLLHRGEPVGLVGDRVVLAADPEEPAVEQPHRAGEDLLARQRLGGEVAIDVAPQRGQRAGEPDHVVELLLVAALAPALVVEVLLAAAVVDAGRLDVAARVRAHPDVLPRGRDHQLADPRQDLGLLDPVAVAVDVGPAATLPLAADPRTGAV
jgi:hypothetical protein